MRGSDSGITKVFPHNRGLLQPCLAGLAWAEAHNNHLVHLENDVVCTRDNIFNSVVHVSKFYISNALMFKFIKMIFFYTFPAANKTACYWAQRPAWSAARLIAPPSAPQTPSLP